MLTVIGTIDIHVVDVDLDARHGVYREELERSHQRAGPELKQSGA
jgi:hypothetical protein